MINDFFRYIPLDLTNIDREAYKTSFPIKNTTLNIVLKKPNISDYYYIDVLDQALEPIVSGVRLQPNVNIMRGIKDERYPNIYITPIAINDVGLKKNLEFPYLGSSFYLMLIDREAEEQEVE